MFNRSKLVTLLIMLLLYTAFACKPLNNGGGKDWVTVNMNLSGSRNESQAINASISGMNSAAAIIVPASRTTLSNPGYLTGSLDTQMINLADNSTEVTVPFNTPLRVIEIAFPESMSLEQVLNDSIIAEKIGISDLFYVTGSTEVLNIFIPLQSNPAISFSDYDFDTGQIGGPITIANVADELDTTQYTIYWGSSASTRLNSIAALSSVPATGSNVSYFLPYNSTIPAGATHLLLSSVNGVREIITSTAITDISKSWTHPTALTEGLVNPGGSTAFTPEVVANQNGDIVIAWVQQNSSAATHVFKSEYRSGSWIAPTDNDDFISLASTSFLYEPFISINASGDTLISWGQYGATYEDVFKSEYRSGGWTHPSVTGDAISAAIGDDNGTPDTAIDDDGNGIIVWTGGATCGGSAVYKSEYRNGSWAHPANNNDFFSVNAGTCSAEKTSVVVDSNGNAIVAWYDSNGADLQLYKSEYRSGSWAHPAGISTHVSSPASVSSINRVPAIAMGSNGDAIIAWKQVDGSANTQIQIAEYRNGSWSNQPDIDDDHISLDGQEAKFADVAMDSNGNTIVVWIQFDGGYWQVYKGEYRNGSWSHPSSLADDHISIDGYDVKDVRVAMDNLGNALIIWIQNDGIYDRLYLSEYREGSWTHPSSIADTIDPGGQDLTTNAFGGRFDTTIDGNGNGIIIWNQSDGVYNRIYKSEFR